MRRVLSLVLLAACSTTQVVRRPDGSTVVLPKCVPVIAYQARSFTIKGISVPIPQAGTTVQIGEVAWDAHTLQVAATVSQIIDLDRVASCEHLVVLAGSVSDAAAYESALLAVFDKESKLSQLAVLIQANNPDAVNRWIEAYASPAPAPVRSEPPGARGALSNWILKDVSVVPLSALITVP